MDLFSILVFAATIGAILFMIWISFRGNPERDEEEAAREYFDEHGRWPDEPELPARP